MSIVLVAIDLSDEDGVIQKLSEKSYQNASNTLKAGGQFILLRVESKHKNNWIKWY